MTSLTQPAPGRRRFKLLRRPPESIRPSTPRPQRRDCQGQLVAAIGEMMSVMIGEAGSIAPATMRPWCSATFVGAQHRITLCITGDHAAGQAVNLSDTLREAEFSLRGHIVADVTIDEVRENGSGQSMIALAVLTIEDW